MWGLLSAELSGLGIREWIAPVLSLKHNDVAAFGATDASLIHRAQEDGGAEVITVDGRLASYCDDQGIAKKILGPLLSQIY